MPVDPVSLDHDALRSALEAAREELLASFFAKGEADRRYIEAFADYERLADALRKILTDAGRSQKPNSGSSTSRSEARPSPRR